MRAKRKRLKAIANDRRSRRRGALRGAHEARRAAAQLARKVRIRNRCEITGRARGYYRKLKMCRNQLRELASQGLIPGMVKSSW